MPRSLKPETYAAPYHAILQQAGQSTEPLKIPFPAIEDAEAFRFTLYGLKKAYAKNGTLAPSLLLDISKLVMELDKGTKTLHIGHANYMSSPAILSAEAALRALPGFDYDDFCADLLAEQVTREMDILYPRSPSASEERSDVPSFAPQSQALSTSPADMFPRPCAPQGNESDRPVSTLSPADNPLMEEALAFAKRNKLGPGENT